jgi:hypothetical protein
MSNSQVRCPPDVQLDITVRFVARRPPSEASDPPTCDGDGPAALNGHGVVRGPLGCPQAVIDIGKRKKVDAPAHPQQWVVVPDVVAGNPCPAEWLGLTHDAEGLKCILVVGIPRWEQVSVKRHKDAKRTRQPPGADL